MKIALFHNLPAGGAKRALYEHARGLCERGHSLDAYIMSTANEHFLPLAPFCHNIYSYPMPPETFPPVMKRILYHKVMHPLWLMAGHKIHATIKHHVDVLVLLKQFTALEAVHRRIARDIDEGGYDLVYVHHCERMLSPFLLRYVMTPTIYFCQDTWRHLYEWVQEGYGNPQFDSKRDRMMLRKRQGQLFRPIDNMLAREQELKNVENARAAGLVLANSWYSREAILRAYGINARVCYLGVDTTFFCPDAAVTKVPVVLSVGSFLPNKCHDFVIDSIATIPKSCRPQLHIIGYETTHYGQRELGPLAQALIRRAEEKEVVFKITKEVDEETLRQGYRQAATVAFAPHLEPFGFVALEAMACGTPVVGVKEGGVRETVVDGMTGFLTHRDPHEFGAAVERILTDTALASVLSRNARATAVEQWSWRQSLDTVENLMQLCLEQGEYTSSASLPLLEEMQGRSIEQTEIGKGFRPSHKDREVAESGKE